MLRRWKKFACHDNKLIKGLRKEETKKRNRKFQSLPTINRTNKLARIFGRNFELPFEMKIRPIPWMFCTIWKSLPQVRNNEFFII